VSDDGNVRVDSRSLGGTIQRPANLLILERLELVVGEFGASGGHSGGITLRLAGIAVRWNPRQRQLRV